MPDVLSGRSGNDTAAAPPKKTLRKCFVRAFFIICFLAAASLLVLEATEPFGQPEACISCHEMKGVYDRWSKSPHHDNPSGIKVTCIACHLPPREDTFAHLTAKTHKGASHVWTHRFGRFDEQASRKLVLDTLPNERCLHCHNNLTVKPSTPAVGAVHTTALKLTGNRTYACVSCHSYTHSKKPPAPEEKFYDTAENSFCYVCHINFKKEPLVVRHKAANVGCVDCHGKSREHADDEDNATAPDIMYTKDEINHACQSGGCHEEAKLKKTTSHKAWYALTDSEKAESKRQYCTDCHGRHKLGARNARQRMWDIKTKKLIWREGHPVDPNAVPETKPAEERM